MGEFRKGMSSSLKGCAIDSAWTWFASEVGGKQLLRWNCHHQTNARLEFETKPVVSLSLRQNHSKAIFLIQQMTFRSSGC